MTSKLYGNISLIIQYTDILHAYGVGSQEAETFKNKYKEDKVFQRKTERLETLIKNNINKIRNFRNAIKK